ncbi:hypothetical protein BVX98_04655 [bacterium F11]|nr:hypothetical protein BVX98_04655 [bacterium F11]
MRNTSLLFFCAIFLVGLMGNLRAQPHRKPEWNVGVGAMYLNRPYRGAGDRFIPLPILAYWGPRFSLLGPRAGYKLIRRKALSLTFTTAYRFAGYDPDDSPFLQGMEKRKDTISIGLTAGYSFSHQIKTELRYEMDALSRNHGKQVTLEISKSFQRQRWSVSPSAGLVYQDANLTDYYYGVGPAESRSNRPAFGGKDSLNQTLGLSLRHRLNQRTTLMAGVTLEYLNQKITDSPIINKNHRSTTRAGLLYRF